MPETVASTKTVSFGHYFIDPDSMDAFARGIMQMVERGVLIDQQLKHRTDSADRLVSVEVTVAVETD